MVELAARDPEDFSLEEVEVRLARPDERANVLVRENHYLEFKRFAGRDLRYVVGPLAGACGLADRRVQVPTAGMGPCLLRSVALSGVETIRSPLADLLSENSCVASTEPNGRKLASTRSPARPTRLRVLHRHAHISVSREAQARL